MPEVQPLPAGMLAPGIEAFVRELPVSDVEVHDRHGRRTYAPPGPRMASEAAGEPEGVVTPGWSASPPEAPPGAPEGASDPEPGPEVPPAAPRLIFNQPNQGPPVGEGQVVEDAHGVTFVFNQPNPLLPFAQTDTSNLELQPGEQICPTCNLTACDCEAAPEGQDLTIEERVEWLEEQVANLTRRLQGTLDANNLWDGS